MIFVLRVLGGVAGVRPNGSMRRHGLKILQGGMAGRASGQQMGFDGLPLRAFQGADCVKGNRFFQFLVRHNPSPCGSVCCNEARSLVIASLIRVFTVPNG